MLVSYALLDVLVAYVLVLYLPDDGDVWLKHVGQFLCMDHI